MKKAKRILLLFLLIGMVALLTAGAWEVMGARKLKGKKIAVGSSVIVKVQKSAKWWKISGRQVAKLTVLDGKRAQVTGLKSGTAKVTVKVGKKTYKCTITVKKASSGAVASANRSGGAQVSSTAIPGTSDSMYYVDTGATVTGHFDTEMANQLISLTNSYRAANGLGTLTVNPRLTQAAKVRAYECSVRFDHTRPNGTAYYTVDSSAVYGENLAYGFNDASNTMAAWKKSSSHNATLLRSNFKTIGIAVVWTKQSSGSYLPYVAQQFGY